MQWGWYILGLEEGVSGAGQVVVDRPTGVRNALTSSRPETRLDACQGC